MVRGIPRRAAGQSTQRAALSSLTVGSPSAARPGALLRRFSVALALGALTLFPAAGHAAEKESKQKEAEPAAEKEGPAEAEKQKKESKEKKVKDNKSDPKPAAASASAGASSLETGGIVFIDGGVRSDLGTFVQKETVGRAENEEVTDIRAFGPMLHVGFLGSLGRHFRLGGAFGYGANYTLVERLEPDNDQDPDRFEMGQLITADVRLEWNQRLSGPLFVVVTPRVGVSMISAGETLKEEISSLQDSHNVTKGPRLGFVAGANAGVRYHVEDWFSLQVAAGYGYTMQSLLRATRRGDAADSKRVWRSSGSRLSGLVGLEAHF